MELTRDNADVYRPRQELVKRAFLNDEPAQYWKPSWGRDASQTFDGPHMVVLVPRSDVRLEGLPAFDVYGCDVGRWLDTHEPVEGVPDGWRKKTSVLAVKLEEETPVESVVDGRLEARTVAPAGHWLVQQAAGEQQVVEPEQFEKLYERV